MCINLLEAAAAWPIVRHYTAVAALLHLCSQVELMVARFTNLRPFPPLGWQRGLVGMVLGAVPHALEGLLGFLIDVADGDEHYRKQYRQRFRERHPGGVVILDNMALLASLQALQRAWYTVLACAVLIRLFANDQETLSAASSL